MVKLFFSFLVFPGFLFSACMGLIACWVDRKLTARLQWRQGPPWYQSFADIIKLFAKETILPQDARIAFLFSPYLGLLSAVLVATTLGKSINFSSESFAGDLIIVLYLLTIPAITTIIGASSSRNPLASLGASREMKLVLAYEFPFILSIVTVIIKCGGVIQLASILSHQARFGANIVSWSGIIAFIVMLLCAQAKLGLVPFDASEAEQEIMAGVFIEYSGIPLAIFKLTRAVMLYVMPLLLIILFWAGNLSPLILIAKYAAILVIITLIRNTNPRLRVDQVLRLFWGPLASLAGIAVILALLGL